MARPGGSRAVETFLRNFEGEKQRYQEILEVALCYGVFCLAQNFSLKGITFEELKAVTRRRFSLSPPVARSYLSTSASA